MFEFGQATSNIDQLIKKYKNYNLETSIAEMMIAKVGEAEIEATLVKQGYNAELVKETMLTIKNNAEKTGEIGTTNTLTVATNKLTVAKKALNVAMNTFGGIIVGIAISAFVSKIVELVNAEKELAESTKQATNELNNTEQSIESYVSQYEDLYEALNKAKGNEEETYKIKQQLLELQQKLNEEFGDAYGKINLVADAYSNASDKIREYSAAANEEYYRENAKGIKNAQKEMSKESSYNLGGSTFFNSLSPDEGLGKEIANIVDQFKDNGMYYDSSNGSFVIRLNADPTTAQETINDFMDEIMKLQKNYDDNSVEYSLLDGIVNKSSERLNDVKEIIDTYQESAIQGQIHDIEQDGLINEYNSLTEAVEKYNNAVLESEDPLNDREVQRTYNNLKLIRDGIKANAKEWGNYELAVNNALDGADTRLFDFANDIKNNQSLQNSANQFQGMSDIEFASLEDSADNTALKTDFDELIESANEYGLTIEDVISVLSDLSILQEQVAETEFIEEPELSFGETITQLDEMTSKFDQLDESYAKFADGDKDTNINFEDYAAIQEAFNDVEGIDEYIQKLQEVNGNAAETQQVFDELATALVEQLDLSEILNEENAGLIAEYLELKGVVNANEIVYGQLQAQQMANTLGIQNLTNATIESLDATYSQINGLLGEADASGIATTALYQLISQQTIFSNSSLNTSQKIQELEKLAKAFGITADSAQVATAQANMASEISIAARNGDTESIAAIQDAYLAEIGSYYEDAIEARFGNLSANYTGGTATQSAIGKASSKSNKETEEIFDWMEEKIENINEEIDKLTTKMEDAVGFRPKNTIADSIIAKLQEEADVYTQMIDRYNQELNSIGLSDDYVAKIKEGLIDIETITDETLLNQIKDYQEWDDKLEDCETQLIEVHQRIEEMQYTKLDNVIDQYDILSSSIENCISTQEQLIDLMGQTGEEVKFENYESLISKQEKLAQQYANAYRDLSNEMSQLNLEQGSEEWEKYNSQLEEYKQNVISCTSAVEDYKDEIFELTFKVLDEFNSRIEEVNNTISVMHDLIGSEGLIDENGLSDRGIAQVALYAHELSNAQKQVVEYEEAMDALEEAYDSGLITQEEYNEALSEYRSGQEAAVQATKQAQDAILQIVKDGIQAQINAKQEEIDVTKEQLAAEKELNDYREGIVDKSKQIAVLEKQIATLSLSTDRADIAQRLELEEQLADLREELISDQEDHAYDEQVDALDKYLESYTEEKKAEIDELETNLDAQTAAINEYLEKVKNNYSTVYGILNQYGDAYSVSAIEDLTDPWSKGSEAANLCSEAIGNVCSEISYDIAQIDMSPLYELVDLLTQINSLGGYGDGSGGYYEDISGQGEWQRGQGGRWWYGEPYSEDGDYWYADSGIYTIDGKQYSFDDNGYMQTEWVEDDDGNWRYFDANTGEMQKGIWIPGRNGEQYYLDKNGTMATNAAVKGENGQDYYYVDEDGVWDGKTLTYDEVKKLGLKVAYKRGTNNAKKGLALTDEEGLGSEVIITKYGALRQLNSGDHVFNADQVKTLYEMSSLTGLPNMLKDMEKNFANMGKNISYNTIGLTITSPLIQIDGTGMSSSEVANLINSQINDLPTRIMKAIKYNLR